jgi:hypothetical protein
MYLNLELKKNNITYIIYIMKKKYHQKIHNIANIIAVTSKVNMVGSAARRKSIYYSDYDLYEIVKGQTPVDLYQHFKSIYIQISLMPNTIVYDFKCGVDSKGNPLRWDANSIMIGENNGVSFTDAVKMQSMIKIDIITVINSRIIEISEVYSIIINGKTNSKSSTKNEIKNDIIIEYKDKIRNGDYFKSLKKVYSIIRLENENDGRLLILDKYLNSEIGLLYRIKSDLETIILIINRGKKFETDVIIQSLNLMNEQLSNYDVENIIETILKTKREKMEKIIVKQVDIIKSVLNIDAKKFIDRTGI